MKFVTVLLIIICCFYSSFAQDSTYNKIFEIPYYAPFIRNAIVQEDTIIMYGMGFPDTINFQQGVFFVKYDKNGNLIHSNILMDTLGEHLAAQSHIKIGTDGGYIVTASAVSRRNALFLKFDRNLNVLLTNEYIDTTALSNYRYYPTVLENGYFLNGEKERQDTYDDGFISLTNEEGEILWTKYLGNLQYENGLGSVTPMNDSLFVFAMRNDLEPRFIGQHTASKSSLHIMNKDGDLLNSYLSEPEPVVGLILKVFVEDGYFLTYGLHISDIVGVSQTRLYQPTFAKIPFDLSGVSWTKPFGLERTLGESNSLRDFVTTYDGHYLGVGSTFINPEDAVNGRVRGWLYKFDKNGDKIWEKTIVPPANIEDVPFTRGFFHSVDVLSDGQIIVVGEMREGSTGIDHPWIVKLDRDGCLEVPCETTVSNKNIPEARGALSAHPNPFSNTINITYNLPTKQTIKLYLLDALGQQVALLEQTDKVVGTHQLSRTTASLAKGIYFVVLESEQGRLVEKIIRQ